MLADRKDPAHPEVVELRRRQAQTGVLVTTDYILDETFTLLFARSRFQTAATFCDRLFEAQKIGMLRLVPITPARFQDAYRLRLRYRDKPRISFTDFSSFAVMRELGIRRAVTADAHFLKVQLGFEILP